MSELVKRAAQAAFAEMTRQSDMNGATNPDDFSDGDLTNCLAYGNFDLLAMMRAAIEAMREPTEAMIRAGEDGFTPAGAYAMMIDEALKEIA